MAPIKVTKDFVPPAATELIEHKSRPENCDDTPPKQQHLGTHLEVGMVSTETEEEKVDNCVRLKDIPPCDDQIGLRTGVKQENSTGMVDGFPPLADTKIIELPLTKKDKEQIEYGYKIPTKYKPLPKIEVAKIKKEKVKKEKLIKPMGPIKSINAKWYMFLKIFFVLATIVFLTMAGIFLYLLGNGSLTPIFNNDFKFDPVLNLDAPINNSFDFEHENNFTIINEITCPDVVCNCGDSNDSPTR